MAQVLKRRGREGGGFPDVVVAVAVAVVHDPVLERQVEGLVDATGIRHRLVEKRRMFCCTSPTGD
jgi:hypothetical protein